MNVNPSSGFSMEKTTRRGIELFMLYRNPKTRDKLTSQFKNQTELGQLIMLGELELLKNELSHEQDKNQISKCIVFLEERKDKGGRQPVDGVLDSSHRQKPSASSKRFKKGKKSWEMFENNRYGSQTQKFLINQIKTQQKALSRQKSRGKVKGGKTALSLFLGVSVILIMLFTFLYDQTKQEAWKILAIITACLSSVLGIIVSIYLIRQDCFIRYR